ncbi:MAG: 50S ribosomal protein L29 [Elusimicrobia bacterium]|nr:50S ribosomal protein L29 [Elusimicrobiota bacterium]
MKKQELKNMTEQELSLNLEESQKTLFGYEIRHRTSPLKNPMEIRTLRRHIARIKTIFKERFNRKDQHGKI